MGALLGLIVSGFVGWNPIACTAAGLIVGHVAVVWAVMRLETEEASDDRHA